MQAGRQHEVAFAEGSGSAEFVENVVVGHVRDIAHTPGTSNLSLREPPDLALPQAMSEVPRPRVGCGAVILDDQNRILLVQRIKAPEAGHWGVPGGKLDWGEATRACAEREIEEELGIRIAAGRVLAVTDMIAEDYHWVAITYQADSFEGVPEIQEDHALQAWGWFCLDDLPSPLTASTADAVSRMPR